MNDLISSVPKDYKPKTFWERPEGVTGQIVGVGLIGGGGYALYKALPYIINLLENTIYAMVLGVAAVGILTVITDRRFWRLGSYFYQSAMRKITQVFVEIDPIGIMRNHVETLQKRLEHMGGRIAALSGMIRSCKDEITRNEGIQKKSMQMFAQAQKAGNKLVMAEESRQIERHREANVTYSDLLNKMQLLYAVLVKYQDISKFLIKDISSEIDVRKRKKEMADAAYSAIQSAKKILNGDADSNQMFDMATEYLANDYAMKIGEIEDFVRMSDTFVQTIDLQNGAYEANAMKMIEEWAQRGDSILLGPDAKQLLLENNMSGEILSGTVSAPDAVLSQQNALNAPEKNWFNN